MTPAHVIIPFLVSFLIMTSLALFAWQRRAERTSRIFFIFTLLVLLWLGGFILEILSPTLAGKRFWSDFQFLGICFFPAAWCFLIVSYLGLPVRFRHLGVLLLPLPVATNLLIWTNPFHHLFRIAPRIDTETAAFPILVNDYGPWFYRVHAPFMYLLFFVSLLLLVTAFFSKKGLYRKQILVLLIALLVPLASDIVYTTGHSPIPNFNLSGILVSFSGLLIAFSLKRQKFLDLMPAARSVLVESMEDGWIVLDVRGRFQDLNPVAEKMLGRTAGSLMGRSADEIQASLPGWQQLMSATENCSVETRMVQNKTPGHYDMNLTLMQDSRRRIKGRLILIRDITRRKTAEAEKERLYTELKASLEQTRKLQGLLPICAHCKNIRDDEGYWHQVEAYVTRHSDATFSHGICPDCMKKLYPDYTKSDSKDPGDKERK
ncbi:MAG: PAS domain-containing protein [Desulfotignum balticum]|jgi:PAS domain S-box-containing protein|uniref:PAS domain-containing protein n=1 Tax=Desulfotignum balticum TaxID=115781 RepID=A0A931G8T4_9BACT|nr:PAS domain-containing protein [Desulfotignum balticum]